MSDTVQESRTAVLGIRVTPRERLSAMLVAGHRGTDVSSLLREVPLDEVLIEAERLRAAGLDVAA